MSQHEPSSPPSRPPLAPDWTEYWDGSGWKRVPGPDFQWDDTTWGQRPSGVESKWTGPHWAVKPSEDAKWSGTTWLPKPEHDAEWSEDRWHPRPAGVESKWTGQQWAIKPSEDAEWNGTAWVPRPEGEHVWSGRRWVKVVSTRQKALRAAIWDRGQLLLGQEVPFLDLELGFIESTCLKETMQLGQQNKCLTLPTRFLAKEELLGSVPLFR